MSRRKSVVPQLDGDAVYNRRLTSIRMGGSGFSAASASTRDDSATMAQELEKTEQAITLVLQEIDRNFSAANRLIVERIVPELLRYGQGTEAVWNRAGFWKEFLESSVDVKLEAYEEDVTEQMDDLSLYHEKSAARAYQDHHGGLKDQSDVDLSDGDHELLGQNNLDGGDLFVSTPKRPTFGQETSSSLSMLEDDRPHAYKSPLKAPRALPKSILMTPRREILQKTALTSSRENDTEGRDTRAFMGFSPTLKHELPKAGILRHQVVDKNWKIQATPKPKKNKKTMFASQDSDDELDISPEPPQLQTDIFGPEPTAASKRSRADVSDLSTPQPFLSKSARFGATPKLIGTQKSLFSNYQGTPKGKGVVRDDTDSSFDFMQGISPPPATLQFTDKILANSTRVQDDTSELSEFRPSHSNDILIRTPSKLAADQIIRKALEEVDRELGNDEDGSV